MTATPSLPAADGLGPEAGVPAALPSPGRRVLRQLRRNKFAMASLIFLGLVLGIAVAAPLVAPYDPNHQLTARILETPSRDHLLGTDDVGRDVLSRLIFGARTSMQASLQTVVMAVLAALPLGLAAGYLGGRVDRLIMRAMDALFAFPPLILALTVAALLGPSLTNATIAIAVVFVPSFVRLVRGQVLAVREEAYIEASRSIGTGALRIVRRHVLPNAAPPLVVQASLGFGFALLAEAGLSFLGLSGQPPTPSWGGMLRRAFDYVLTDGWQLFIPGGAIMLTVLAFNLLGDGLRDALGLDVSTIPRRRRRRHRRQERAARAGTRETDSPGETAAGTASAEGPALQVRGLHVAFASASGWLPVVQDVDLAVAPGRTLGLVGESGSGKTVTALAIMGLLPPDVAETSAEVVRLRGRNLRDLSPRALRGVQGTEMAMIFQEPMTSLNPAFTVGEQIAEVVRHHQGFSRRAARAHATDMLGRVGIPSPQQRVSDYPHQFSGGMRQRAMIAMALACDPSVLIADEPTTALDVTVQAQILELLRSLQSELGMAMVFVTHDLGVVADICDEVAVMYAGQVVEHAGVERLFDQPAHPYTERLLLSMPRTTAPGQRLPVIAGQVPLPGRMPSGCRFNNRCPYAQDACRDDPMPLRQAQGAVTRCVRHHELVLRGTS